MAWTQICETKALTDETWTPFIVSLRDGKTSHGLEVLLTGTGSVTITPETSISVKSWVDEGAIVTGFNATGGPGGDGKDIFDLLISPAEYIRFKVVATGSVVITMWFTEK